MFFLNLLLKIKDLFGYQFQSLQYLFMEFQYKLYFMHGNVVLYLEL